MPDADRPRQAAGIEIAEVPDGLMVRQPLGSCITTTTTAALTTPAHSTTSTTASPTPALTTTAAQD
jgi:hypothetical protein